MTTFYLLTLPFDSKAASEADAASEASDLEPSSLDEYSFDESVTEESNSLRNSESDCDSAQSSESDCDSAQSSVSNSEDEDSSSRSPSDDSQAGSSSTGETGSVKSASGDSIGSIPLRDAVPDRSTSDRVLRTRTRREHTIPSSSVIQENVPRCPELIPSPALNLSAQTPQISQNSVSAADKGPSAPEIPKTRSLSKDVPEDDTFQDVTVIHQGQTSFETTLEGSSFRQDSPGTSFLNTFTLFSFLFLCTKRVVCKGSCFFEAQLSSTAHFCR